MSSHASTKIDQKEYLKKYLSGDKVKKKKKDKKRKKDFGAAKVKIIDDDATFTQTQDDFAEEILLGGDDAPQIVGEYIQEPSSGVNAPKWRNIGIKEEPTEESASNKQKQPVEDLWGPKQSKRKIKDEFSPTRSTKRQGTPDNSPPRRKHRQGKLFHVPGADLKMSKSSANNSPPRRNNLLSKHDNVHSPNRLRDARSSSTDQSPPRKQKHKSTKNKERSRSRSNDHNHHRRGKHYASSDLSPNRSRKNRMSSLSPEKKSSRNSSDQSPPRRNGISPKRNKNRDSSSDFSPPRGNIKNKKQSNSPITNKNTIDQLPPRTGMVKARSITPVKKKRRNSSDQSPPRRKARSPQKHAKRHTSSDLSPPRRQDRATERQRKRDSSSDLSPPRSRKNKKHSMSPVNKKSGNRSDQSPRRRQINQDSSSDISPPRRKKHKKPSISPKKRDGKNSSDLSPPRRHNTPPVRIKREKFSPNQSPPRQRSDFIKKEPSSPPPKQSRWSKLERRNSDSPPPTHKPKASKTLDGKKAGLQDAKSLNQETEERRQRENRMYNEMSKEISGRDAEVQVRTTGRKGRRAREAAEEDPEVRRRKDEHERKKKEKYDRWGKGLKQVEEHQQRREAESYEGSKPLARYENDEDLDRYLREQERADDPMLEYMRKKKKERQKDEGVVAEIPKYEGTYPENRFGIRPGYRWDGVDRSNGFEKKWFDVQNEKRAKQEEAYLYSVEDM